MLRYRADSKQEVRLKRIMMFAGIGLALGSWASFVLVTVTAIATYLYRVTVEEKALLTTIGEPYNAYIKDRKRFIPYIV